MQSLDSERAAVSHAQRFDLAPMSTGLKVMSAIVLAIPLLLLAVGFVLEAMAMVAGTILTVALVIWIALRPSAFEVDRNELRIRWTVRRKAIPRAEIAAVRQLRKDDLARELAPGLRIGAGGLFGVFGWLWTRKHGLVETYVTRSEGLVLIERTDAKPLCLTPDDPDRFVRALGG